MEVLLAYYGPKDVTSIVQSKVFSNKLVVDVSNSIFGDPMPGTTKTLVVYYRFDASRIFSQVGLEGTKMVISDFVHIHTAPGPKVMKTAALAAVYGPKDVTLEVSELLAKGIWQFKVDNGIFGDPFPGQRKVLTVVYQTPDGMLKPAVAFEGAMISLN